MDYYFDMADKSPVDVRDAGRLSPSLSTSNGGA